MSALAAILGADLRAAAHTLAAVRRESKLKLAFVSASIALLWLAGFALAKAGLAALDRLGVGLLGTTDLSLVELLIPRVLSVFAFVLFILLVFSNALLAHATLYRSRQAAMLLTTPTTFRTVVLSRLAGIAVFSSWSSAYLGSPVVLAYGLVRHAPWSFYLVATALFVPFVIIPAALGTLLTMVIVRVAPRLPRAALAIGAIVLLAAAFAFFRAQVRDPQFREVVELSAALRLTAQADSPLLPSFWLANGMVAGTHGALGDATYEFLFLFANALLLAWLTGEAAQRLFHPGWSGLAGAERAVRRTARAPCDMLARLSRPIPGAARWLTVKDVRLFAREPAQWSQFLIFFGMLLLYVAGMRTGTRGTSTAMWQSLVTLLNSAASLLVLATLTTRFVFPLVSLEGRRFWVLAQAPLSRRLLVAQKFWLSVVFSAAITIVLTVVSGWRLHLPPLPFAYSLFTVVTASFALSGLAVGLGSLYPNLAEESPARIVSGLGGTLTFILSAVYVLLAAGGETVVLNWHRIGSRAGETGAYPWVVAAVVAGTLAVAVLTTLLPLALGARNLENLEV
ncbi:MAG: hypothetical protein ABR961_02210 [Thermoanaerobaculaceae bacterium]